MSRLFTNPGLSPSQFELWQSIFAQSQSMRLAGCVPSRLKRPIDFAVHRVQQRRVPQPPAGSYAHWLNQIIQLAKTSPVFSRDFSKRIIRLSFASRSVSGAALSAIALNKTCLLEPFTRAGSRSENFNHGPDDRRGQQPRNRCDAGT
jgi:hypothetical protein